MTNKFKLFLIISLIIILVSCEISLGDHTHVWSEWTTLASAEKTTDGLEERVCPCGEREERAIPYLGSEGLLFEYSEISGGYLVSVGECTDENVIIPAMHKGEPVVGIGFRAFYKCDFVKSVEMPDTIRFIDYYAFQYSGIEAILIPSSVMGISEQVFYGCTSLVSITVDESNQYYKSVDGVLYSKDGKKLEVYPSGKKDAEYIIPDGVEIINIGAFYGCEALVSVAMPNSVISIGQEAFSKCYLLSSIDLSSALEEIGTGAFEFCSSLKEIELPKSLIEIGSNAFSSCESLEEIFIPMGVSKLGDNAFVRCFSLESIVVDESNESYRTIDGNLYSKDGGALIQYAIGKQDESFSVPNGVNIIKAWAFEQCTSLKTVTLPSTLSELCDGVFRNCYSLESINIPISVKKMGRYVFHDCEQLTIYCEAKVQPEGWDNAWTTTDCVIVWNYKTE